MTRTPWHITRTDSSLTLSRRLPARFDVVAETVLPAADPLRLAHQIRQDMWRKLQSLRGFSPVVEITAEGQGLRVRAGGQVTGRVPANAAALIAEVLDNPARRARWIRHASRGRDASLPDSPADAKDSHRFAAKIDMEAESAS
ncbi:MULTISPECIES: hypothetical protein [unclassified Leisingera]|uniref:hypothetical protein n=1 Tax=unclassified Leisingera TaxID=2614906 RepID=UPI00057D834C|nr:MULTISPECIES: hypothetical protein [unclassified Leisingera]KIC16816.1 hypothetical protein RA21_11485 [Leisingera sp. ANG-DT]KIC34433.1 hypothetical protein RA25_01150 [Leisingera sp. ANG-S5]